MLISTHFNNWYKVPVAVKQFLLRAIIILLIWKILYLVFLVPARVLDQPLSHNVASGAAWILNKGSHSTNFSNKTEIGNVETENGLVMMTLNNIYFHKENVVSIEDGCNALELLILYAGFIVCMPALLYRKIIYILGGIILIHIVNILRCAGLTYMILYDPKHAAFAHHYIFTFIVYGLIIGLWLIFSRKLNIKNGKTE